MPSNLNDAMEQLSYFLDEQAAIHSERDSRIDSLKTILASSSSEDSLTVLNELVKSYMHFQLDPFFEYSDIAIEHAYTQGKVDLAKTIELKKIESYPLNLQFGEATAFLDSVDVESLSPANQLLFYDVARKVYLYFTTVHSSGKLYSGYMNKFSEYNDSLLSLLPPTDKYYKLYLGTKYIYQDDISLGIAVLSELMSEVSMTDEKYVDVASMLGLAYFLRGRVNMWLYAITLVAISEIKLAVRDGEVLRRLASGYYNEGHREFAYRLMLESDKNVAESGAFMRSVHISEDVPIISGAYLSSQRDSQRRLYIILLCVVVFFVLIIAMFYGKLKDRKRLDEMAQGLAQANKIKDVYISQFLELCSTYVDKMEDFNKLVSRKLTAGQVEELFHLVKTEKVVEEQRKLVYDIFDEAFMQIYPSFINEV
ncbi:MAG: DUF6377 domain-containing protein, partial [Lachnospiraceae bacterium]|nr:DUF6377 domain-containing protein [Lachnospiraceae bacterium]